METAVANLPRITRKQRPERIQVGDETFERNDLVAGRFAESERNLNRKDRLGAPYIFFGGCKYRPIERYSAFLLTLIKQKQPETARGHRRSITR
jgi:hypothetical protein